MLSIEIDYYRKMQKALIINDNEKKISASALTLFQSKLLHFSIFIVQINQTYFQIKPTGLYNFLLIF